MPDSNEQTILLAARELLPQFPELWERDYIDIDGLPFTAQRDERAIAETLRDLWTDTGVIGLLTSLPDATRALLLDVIVKVCR